MSLLAWIVVGRIVGGLTSQVLKGDSFAVIGDFLGGVLGGLLGGFVAWELLGMPDPISSFNVISIGMACIGAIIVIVSLRAAANTYRAEARQDEVAVVAALPPPAAAPRRRHSVVMGK